MITARLQCIINHVSCKTAADIGTDHAYVPVRLIDDGRAEHVIASDIRTGPVNAAVHTVNKYGIQDKIEVRQGSGLSVLRQNEADLIIIAGMGGQLIQTIIEEHKSIAENARLILQPMNDQYELRKYLMGNGFEIACEDLAVEGFKVYNVMIVKKGFQQPFDRDIFYHLPECLFGHRHFKELYEKKMREFTKVVSGLEHSKETDTQKLEEYRKWLKDLKGLKFNESI